MLLHSCNNKISYLRTIIIAIKESIGSRIQSKIDCILNVKTYRYGVLGT